MEMFQLSALDRELPHKLVEEIAGKIRDQVVGDDGATVEFRRTGAGLDQPAVQIVAGPSSRMDMILCMIPNVLPKAGGLWRVEHFIGPSK